MKTVEKSIVDAEETMRVLLESKLGQTGANPAWLTRLAEIYRRQGKLDQAAETYRRANDLQPDAGAIFGYSSPCRPLDQPHPAPFVCVDDFLPEAEIQELNQYALANQKIFAEALVGQDNEINTTQRKGLILRELGEFRGKLKQQAIARLPEVLDKLARERFEISTFEVEVSNHLDGHFFGVHYDDYPGVAHRQLNMVLFVHDTPARFTGGDLLLHDHAPAHLDARSDQLVFNGYTRFIPRRNRAVFFLPSYFHEVTPVHLAENDFAAGRLAVVAHFGVARR